MKEREFCLIWGLAVEQTVIGVEISIISQLGKEFLILFFFCTLYLCRHSPCIVYVFCTIFFCRHSPFIVYVSCTVVLLQAFALYLCVTFIIVGLRQLYYNSYQLSALIDCCRHCHVSILLVGMLEFRWIETNQGQKRDVTLREEGEWPEERSTVAVAGEGRIAVDHADLITLTR